MRLKFIGLLLLTLLTALCGWEFGGEIQAGGRERCAPVNFEPLRMTEASGGTWNREDGAAVSGMMNPAMAELEKLPPDSWKKSGLAGEYAEVQSGGEPGLPETAVKRLYPDFRERLRRRLSLRLPGGRAPPALFC